MTQKKMLYLAAGAAVGYLFLSRLVPTKVLSAAAGAGIASMLVP